MTLPHAQERPDFLSDLQRPPTVPPAAPIASLLFDDRHQPITTREAWATHRAQIEHRWRRYLGEIERPAIAPTVTVLAEDTADNGAILRQHVTYDAEPGVPVQAYLLRPREPAKEKRPAVAVFHSTVDHTIQQPAGLAGPANKHLGLQLARRGYVTLCPENFLWAHGAPGHLDRAVDWLRGRHPNVTGMAKMLFDSLRAVDVLHARDDVDGARIGAIGHSLGAKEVLYLAAFDPRVRATVSSEGGIGLDFSNWEAPWYLGDAIQRPGFALNHTELLALVAPRAFLLLGGDSADGDRSWPYIAANLPVWKLNDAPDTLGWINHHAGHELPVETAERAYEWLDFFLKRS